MNHHEHVVCSYGVMSVKSIPFSGRGKYRVGIARASSMTEHVEGTVSIKNSAGQPLFDCMYRSDKGGFKHTITVSDDDTYDLTIMGSAHSFASGLFGCPNSAIDIIVRQEVVPGTPSLERENSGKIRARFDRLLFGVSACFGRGLRSAFAGLATGTRGPNVFYYADSDQRLVALTIDDAPSRSAAEFRKLLDLLKELNVHATFQVISGHVSSTEHRELLERAVVDGHQLTNHCTLDEKCTSLSREEFYRRLKDCQDLLDELVPQGRRWFRPPCGLMSETMRSVLIQEGYIVCLGDCYSSDPTINDVEFHCRTLLRGVRSGSVIIVHCPEQDNHRHQTLELLPRLVRELRDRGLVLATLDELFPLEYIESLFIMDDSSTRTSRSSPGRTSSSPTQRRSPRNCLSSSRREEEAASSLPSE